MVLEDRWLRETYVDLLIEYAAKNKDIVILEADLMKAGGTFRFAEKYPERTFDVGIQEANMIGTAAGMSAMGKIPFTHTFTAFATRRVCDQVTLSVAYAGLNVKMMGSDPGVTAEYNGGTHMSMEDVSIMRNIPGMIVYEPVDSAQLKAIFPQIVDHYGPVYIRLLRRNAVKVFEDGETFELGKGKLMREGSDVSIFATGIMVAEAVEAVEELAKELPVVIISNKEKTTTVDAINQDNSEVGRLMARHLLDLGHRDVAFITPPLTRRQWQRSRRIEGFISEFEKEGLKGHVRIKAADVSIERRLPRMDSEYSMGYQLTRELLDEGCHFTAIAGQNDMMAFGAIDALEEARVRVPKDVSVIGCDDIFYSGIRRLSLTTIDHFVALKGRDACDIIIRKITTNDQFYTGLQPTSLYNIEYTPKLIARKTTSYARTGKAFWEKSDVI